MRCVVHNQRDDATTPLCWTPPAHSTSDNDNNDFRDRGHAIHNVNPASSSCSDDQKQQQPPCSDSSTTTAAASYRRPSTARPAIVGLIVGCRCADRRRHKPSRSSCAKTSRCYDIWSNNACPADASQKTRCLVDNVPRRFEGTCEENGECPLFCSLDCDSCSSLPTFACLTGRVHVRMHCIASCGPIYAKRRRHGADASSGTPRPFFSAKVYCRRLPNFNVPETNEPISLSGPASDAGCPCCVVRPGYD